jgi:hypothetical protein
MYSTADISIFSPGHISYVRRHRDHGILRFQGTHTLIYVHSYYEDKARVLTDGASSAKILPALFDPLRVAGTSRVAKAVILAFRSWPTR